MVCESLEHLIHLRALVCACDAETVLGSVINTGCMCTLSLGARVQQECDWCLHSVQLFTKIHPLLAKIRALTTDQNPLLGFFHSVLILGSVSQVPYCVSTQIWSVFRISALSSVKMLYLCLVLVPIICVITCLYASIIWIYCLITCCQKGHEIFICEDWLHPSCFSLHWQYRWKWTGLGVLMKFLYFKGKWQSVK